MLLASFIAVVHGQEEEHDCAKAGPLHDQAVTVLARDESAKLT